MPATESQSVTDLIAALDGHAPDRVTPLLVLADAMADAEDPREAGVRTLAAIGYRTSYYRGLRLPWTWWRHVGSDANDNLINYHDSWHPWWDQMTGDCSYGAGNAKDYRTYSEAVLDAATAFTRLTPDQQRAILDAADPA